MLDLRALPTGFDISPEVTVKNKAQSQEEKHLIIYHYFSHQLHVEISHPTQSEHIVYAVKM